MGARNSMRTVWTAPVSRTPPSTVEEGRGGTVGFSPCAGGRHRKEGNGPGSPELGNGEKIEGPSCICELFRALVEPFNAIISHTANPCGRVDLKLINESLFYQLGYLGKYIKKSDILFLCNDSFYRVIGYLAVRNWARFVFWLDPVLGVESAPPAWVRRKRMSYSILG